LIQFRRGLQESVGLATYIALINFAAGIRLHASGLAAAGSRATTTARRLWRGSWTRSQKEQGTKEQGLAKFHGEIEAQPQSGTIAPP
jgi:hypothetical protein